MTQTRLPGALIQTGSIPGSALSGSVEIQSMTISGLADLTRYALATSSLGNASGSMSINLTNGNYFVATTTNTTNWSFTNVAGSRAVGFVLSLTSGGNSAQTWPNSVRWPNGTPPSLTSAGVDILTFITDNGGTAWRGVLSMKDSK